jgi:hypothetical protein
MPVVEVWCGFGIRRDTVREVQGAASWLLVLAFQ